jgi:hypothetical protein
MPRSLTRALVAALTIMTLAAPAALARPGGPASPEATDAAARSARVQDLRHLKAGNDIRTSSLAGTTSPGTADPVYWSYDYAAPDPQSAPAVESGDGTPWTAIAVGLAGACLLVGCVAAAGRVRVRARRARTA